MRVIPDDVSAGTMQRAHGAKTRRASVRNHHDDRSVSEASVRRGSPRKSSSLTPHDPHQIDSDDLRTLCDIYLEHISLLMNFSSFLTCMDALVTYLASSAVPDLEFTLPSGNIADTLLVSSDDGAPVDHSRQEMIENFVLSALFAALLGDECHQVDSLPYNLCSYPIRIISVSKSLCIPPLWEKNSEQV
jgi:hypothetical protein